MNQHLYAIRDRIAQELVGRMMYCVMSFNTPAQAARYFADAVNDESSVLNKHPGDYELIHLGTITHDGTITPDPISIIITGDALIATQQPTLVKEA